MASARSSSHLPSAGPPARAAACLAVAALAGACLAAAAVAAAGPPGQWRGGAQPGPVRPARSESAFVELEPFVVGVIHDNRLVETVTLVIALEVPGPEGEAEVAERLPHLRNAFIARLNRVVRWNPRGGRSFDAAAVKRALLAESERVLGPGVVREVLIQSAFEQPVR